MELWPEGVIALVAVYGAVLSTITLGLRLSDRAPQVEAVINWGLTAPGMEEALTAEARNPGATTVYIEAPSLRLPDGKQMVFPDGWTSQAPHGKPLPHGEKWFGVVPTRDIAADLADKGYRGIVDIRAVFKDRLGNEYVSNQLQLNLNRSGA